MNTLASIRSLEERREENEFRVNGFHDVRGLRAPGAGNKTTLSMIEHPNNNLGLFLAKLRKGDTVYIHPEAEYHPSTTLQKIINADMIPGIAINPGTSVETVMEMLRIVKKVLVMSVNPGNAGQMYLPYVGKKITRLLSIKEDMEFEIYWDGACSADKILEFAPKGVKGFVLGTTLLFGKEETYGETLQNIRELKF